MRVLDLVLPPACASCSAPGWPLCPPCTDQVGVVTPPWCARCGRPWEEALASCADCPPPSVDRARSPFLYDGPLARAIRGMKFSGWHALGPHLAGAMAEVAPDVLPAGVVTWVPLSRRRRSRRGFDQAEVIARSVGARLDLPVVPLLRRVRETGAQARRSGADRRRALMDAFQAVHDEAPETVLLVDDVLTTGATAAACAGTLKRAGVETVHLLTAARSLGGPVPARCLGPRRRGTGEAARVP
ncbi:MAG TPA: double zinc ribbon domain-containing protein [Actinomycetota bacterium]|nr:double zinc ribbon domain-containing protein [Actinomycetota bacterium]